MIDYRLCWDSYTGLGGFSDGSYLVKYPRETDEKYARRRQLAIYPNFVKKIVDTYVGALFRVEPQRDFATNTEYAEFCQNVDLRVTDIDDFMRNIAKLTLIYGTVFVIVDKPKADAPTKAHEKLRGIRPYATIRLPTQIKDIEIDSYGRIQKIVFSEPGMLREFTPGTWRVRIENEVYEGATPFKEVPVVAVSWTDPILPTDVIVPPFVHDIAKVSKDLYNAISELREILRNSTFPILTIPIPDQISEEKLRNIVIGTENFIGYYPEKGGKPDFIAPPESPAKVYLEYINTLIDMIYSLANLEFVKGTEKQKSGVALEFEFQNLNSLLTQIAQNLEQAEYRIADLVAKWEGKDGFKGSIIYEKDFSYRDVERELKKAMDALTLNISATFDAELKKYIARMLLGSEIDDATMQRIEGEIDGLEGLDNQMKNELGL
jgi:hypothetical protein